MFDDSLLRRPRLALPKETVPGLRILVERRGTVTSRCCKDATNSAGTEYRIRFPGLTAPLLEGAFGLPMQEP